MRMKCKSTPIMVRDISNHRDRSRTTGEEEVGIVAVEEIEGIIIMEEEVEVECKMMTVDITTDHEEVDVVVEEVPVVHLVVDMEVLEVLVVEDMEDHVVHAVVMEVVEEEEDDLVVQWVKIAMDRVLDEEEVEAVHEEVRGEVLEVMTVLNAEDMVDIKLLFVYFISGIHSVADTLYLVLTVYRIDKATKHSEMLKIKEKKLMK